MKKEVLIVMVCAMMVATSFAVAMPTNGNNGEPNPYMPIFDASQTPWQINGENTWIRDFKVGDANNDGLNELVIAGWYWNSLMDFSVAYVRIYEIDKDSYNLLATTEWYHPDSEAGDLNRFMKVAISDIDQDGKNEMVGIGYAMERHNHVTAFMNIYKMDETNTIVLVSELTWNDGYLRMIATDIEIFHIGGDSYPEIVVATTGSNGGTDGKFIIRILNFNESVVNTKQLWEHPGMIGYHSSAVWFGNVDESPTKELVYLTMYGTGACDPLWMYIVTIDTNFVLSNERQKSHKWGCEVGPSDVISVDMLGNDGIEEIFTASHTNAAEARFSRWKATTTSIEYDAYYSINSNGHTYGLTIYDMDGDGSPEFFTTGNTRHGIPGELEAYVFDGSTMNLLANFGNENYVLDRISNVDDVDNDGRMEIVLGGSVSSHGYTEIWEMPGPLADAGPDQTVNEGDVVQFNGCGSAWNILADMPVGTTASGSAVYSGKTYVFGGYNNSHPSGPYLALNQYYDPSSDTWSIAAPIPLGRGGLGGDELGGKIYAVGGFAGGMQQTDRYSPIMNSWITVASTNLNRPGAGIVAFDGKLYAIGGTWGGKFTLEAYDPTSNSWSMMANLLYPRAFLGVAALDDKIYAVGGKDVDGTNIIWNTVEAYNPVTNSWVEVAPMMHPRAVPGVSAIAGKLYVFGGDDGTGYIDTVESYDPSTNTWSQEPCAMPEANGRMAVEVIGGTIYLAGGGGEFKPSNSLWRFKPNLVYEWDINNFADSDGDGNFTNDVDATGPTPNHIYGDNGNYTVTMAVTDNLNNKAYDTMNVTVLNLDPIAEISSVFMTTNLTLRVTGEKWHDATIHLYEDDVEVLFATVVRSPGNPDEQAVTIENVYLDLTKEYSAKVVYTPDDDPINSQSNGANPAWIILTFDDGTEERIHHTFNVMHPETWEWNVGINQYLIGHNLTLEASAHDPGSDDLNFTWDFGGGTIIEHVYYNNGIGSDPYPSPDGVFPFKVTDVVKYVYTGIVVVSLSVWDDDSGNVKVTITLA